MTRVKLLAYADPPYPGCAYKYADDPNANEVNHQILIGTLEAHYPDGWALSTSVSGLAVCLPFITVPYHVGAWVRTRPKPYRNQRILRAWEPVIFGNVNFKGRPKTRDWISATKERDTPKHLRLEGSKPATFCFWLLDMLDYRHGDSVHTLFPGTRSLELAKRTRDAQPAFQFQSA